jgi:2',3'-cyclic-nucleotide 2'-phosphodiesterase (5'-nucleotidase family)
LQVNALRIIKLLYFDEVSEVRGTVSILRFALICVTLVLCLSGAAHHARAQAPAAAVAPTPAGRAAVTETSVDSTLPDDHSVDKMLEAYSPKVRALDEIIGKLNGDLRKGGVGAGSIGNFVTDGLRAQASQKLAAPVLLALTNNGGLRKSAIAGGDLRLLDIFELLPFENALVAFDVTGAQIIQLLRISMSHLDAQSGARVTYKLDSDKRPQFASAKLLINGQEKTIDPSATYTIISIDYLLNVSGGDYAAVLREAKNIRPLGLTMRDAMTQYVKSETAAGRAIEPTMDGRFVFEKTPGAESEAPPQ